MPIKATKAICSPSRSKLEMLSLVCFDLARRQNTRGLGLIYPGPSKPNSIVASMTTDDVYTSKKAFLEGQVRRLSAHLGPSRQYRALAASAEDNDRLSDTLVDNAIYKGIHTTDFD